MNPPFRYETPDLLARLHSLSALGAESPDTLESLITDEPRVHYFHVARHFTDTPGGRTRDMHTKPGFSGEELRATLTTLLRDCQHPASPAEVLVVELGGSYGYAASFLDEAFAGLIYREGFTLRELSEVLILLDSDNTQGTTTQQEINGFLEEAEQWAQEDVVVYHGPFGRGDMFLPIIVTPEEEPANKLYRSGLPEGVTPVFEGKRRQAQGWIKNNPLPTSTPLA